MTLKMEGVHSSKLLVLSYKTTQFTTHTNIGKAIIAIKHSKLMLVSFCFLTGTMGPIKDAISLFTPEVGSLFSFSKDWKPTKHLSKITISNGLAWSEDLQLMYYIDSETRKVEAFDFDAKIGRICEYSCFNNVYENSYFSMMFRTSV
jgi:hypothetical protein